MLYSTYLINIKDYIMNEKIILTQYFYPLKEGGTERFFGGIYFDNPRTKKEIKYVADFIRHLNYSSNRPFPEKASQVPEDCLTLWSVVENIYINNKEESVVSKYYQNVKKLKNVYYALAKMWIIVRCDKIIDETALDQIYIITTAENIKDFNSAPPPPNNLLNYNRIKKLLGFLSFMTNSDCYINESIIINDIYGLEQQTKFYKFFPFILTTSNIDKKKKTQPLTPPFVTFDILFDYYKEYINLVKENYTNDKFLFICDSIANISDLQLKNPRMYLLGIVGIIEMLLTHNPDSSLYNIEDSISKQYIRKLKYVLFRDNPSLDINKIEKILKLSYKIRSDVAHGNFGKSSVKNLDELLKIYDLKLGGKGIDYVDYETGICYLNDDLTEYAKILLTMYLKNPKELELLKDL